MITEEWVTFCGDENWYIIVKAKPNCPAKAVAKIINDPDEKEIAQIIIKAVNACKQINPSNPMAVAERIEKMCSTLRMVREELIFGGDWETARDKIDNILSKVEEK